MFSLFSHCQAQMILALGNPHGESVRLEDTWPHGTLGSGAGNLLLESWVQLRPRTLPSG